MSRLNNDMHRHAAQLKHDLDHIVATSERRLAHDRDALQRLRASGSRTSNDVHVDIDVTISVLCRLNARLVEENTELKRQLAEREV